MTLNSTEKLFEHELRDIYDAEKRLTKALPALAEAASSEELRDAIQDHLEVTENQVKRLDEIFKIVGLRPGSKTCLGMKGLIEEGEEAAGTEGDDPFTDLAIIGAARRVEHYEMAAYMTLEALAEKTGDSKVLDLIQQTLQEEQEADETLQQVAESLIEEEEMEDVEETDELDAEAEELVVDNEEDVEKTEKRPATAEGTASAKPRKRASR